MLQIQVITDLATEPVTLAEAKSFLQVDYTDWDTLITLLISAARTESENITGLAYGAKVIQVTGNTECEKIYPVQPFVSAVTWADEDEDKDYRYNAGLTTLPADLKLAILMRVSTGFSYRENSTTDAVNATINASINKEIKYRNAFVG